MKAVLLILALCAIAYSGQIYSWSDPFIQSHQTTDAGSMITLYFSLENTLPAGAFLRVLFPFVFTSNSATATIYMPSSRCGMDPQAMFGAMITMGTLTNLAFETNSGFVAFSKPLDKNTNYAVVLTINSAASGAALGLSGQIGLSTVTSNIANYLMIDSNPHFAEWEWASPASTFLLENQVLDAGFVSGASIGASYNLNFTITPAVTYLGGAIIRIMPTSDKFKLTSCAIMAVGGNASAVPALWTCAVNPAVTGSSLTVIQINAPDWLGTQVILVKVGVTNPNAILSTTLDAKIYSRNLGRWVEKATSGSWLVSSFLTQWVAATSSIQTAFGPVNTATNHPLKFYKQAAGTVLLNYVYQTYKFVMKPTAATPQGFKTSVVVNLGTKTSNYEIIESSIHHNLDSYSTSVKVYCYAVTATADNTIQCDNVNLGSSTSYFVSIKIAMLKTATTVPTGFGFATIKAMANPDATSISATDFIASSTLGSVTLVQINPIHDPTTLTTPVAGASGFTTVEANATAGQKTYFDTSATPQIYKQWMATPVAATGSPSLAVAAWATGVNSYGFEWLFNQYVTQAAPTIAADYGFHAITAATNALTVTAAVAGDTFTVFNIVNGTTALPYTRIRVGVIAASTTAWATDKAWSVQIKNMIFNRAPSLRADEASFEIYTGLTQGMTTNTSDVTYVDRSGFLSLLVMNNPTTNTAPFATLYASLTGAFSTENGANRAPGYLRVQGTLAGTGEITNVQRLVIFFNNVLPFSVNREDNVVQCAGTSAVTAAPTCTYYKGVSGVGSAQTAALDRISLPRIEVTWTGVITAVAAFQLVIPVTAMTLASHTLGEVWFATLDAVNSPLLLSSAFAAGGSAAGSVVIQGVGITKLTVVDANATKAYTARFTPGAATDKVGGLTVAQFKMASGDTDVIAATFTDKINIYASGVRQVGAAFTYCAQWNFYANATIGTNSLIVSGATTDSCTTFALPMVSSIPIADGITPVSDNAPKKWCMYCPLGAIGAFPASTNIVAVTNFQLWNGGNKWVKNTNFGSSPTLGCVHYAAGLHAFCDESYEAVNPGNLSASLSVTSMANTSLGVKMSIGLTLSNPFPTTFSVAGGLAYVYMRMQTQIFNQESGSQCWVIFGTSTPAACTFTNDVTTSATTGDDGESISIIKPNTISFSSPSILTTNVTIVLYGMKPITTAAAIATTSIGFSTRQAYATTPAVYNTILDASTANASFAITVQANATIVPVIGAVDYPLINGLGSRTYLRIPFRPSGRDLFMNEKFQIMWNNTALTTGNNVPANLLCEVYDSNTNTFLHLFKSCLIEATQITLTAGADISMSLYAPVLYVRSYTVTSFGNFSLGAKVLSAGSSPLTLQETANNSTVVNVPTTTVNTNITFASGDLVVSRIQNQVGYTSTLQFVIKNSAGVAVGAGWRVLIDFPWYYSPRLSNIMNFRCLINNASTTCEIIDHRLLQVWFPTSSVANGSSFTLRVVGISNPKYTTAGMFYVALDNDTNNNYVNQHGWVSDLASAVEPTVTNTLWVYNATVTSPSGTVAQLRSATTWNWILQARVALTAGQVLVLDFSDWWFDVIASSIPSGLMCMATTSPLNMTLGTNVTAAGVWWTAVGNQIKLNLTAAVAANNQLNVTCMNVRAPDMPFPAGCSGTIPVFSVFDANESVPIARSVSASAIVNRAFVFAPFDASLMVLNWQNNMAVLPQGTSTPMGMENMLPSGTSAFSRGITLAILPAVSGIAIAPMSGMAMVGDMTLKLALQVASTASLGINYIMFSKTEAILSGAVNAYAVIPSIKLKVTNSKVMVMPPPAFTVPVGGKSVPVTFMFSNPPQADVTFNVNVNDSSSASVSPATVTLAPNQQRLTVVVSLTSTAIVDGKIILFLSQPSGTNALSFNTLPNNMTIITVGPAQTDTPTIMVSADSSAATNSPTKQSLMVTVGTTNMNATAIPPVNLFWACALKSLGVTRDLVYAQKQVADMMIATQPSNMTMGNEVFGGWAWNAPTASGTSILISGLNPSSAYTCRVWAINQVSNNASNTSMFTTSSNGGKLVRVNFNFNAMTMTSANTQSLLCWLVQSFSVKAGQIRTVVGERCGGMAKPFTVNSTFVDASNITNQVVAFYFLPNMMVDMDTFSTMVQTQIGVATWIASIRTMISSFISTANYTAVGTTTPSVATPMIVNTSTGANVTFAAPVNNTPAFAYVGAWNNMSMAMNTDLVMMGPGSVNMPISGAHAYFNGSVWSPPVIQISNLTSGANYNLFYTITCEDPSENSINCASAAMGPMIVSPGGTGAVTTNPNNGGTTNSGTTDARIVSVCFSMMIVLILALFV